MLDSRWWDPSGEPRVQQGPDLAVDGPGDAVDHEEPLVGGRHEELREDARRADGPAGVAPRHRGGGNGVPNPGDELHFTCGGNRKKARIMGMYLTGLDFNGSRVKVPCINMLQLSSHHKQSPL